MTISGRSDWESHRSSCPSLIVREPNSAPDISATSPYNLGGSWRFGPMVTTGRGLLAKLEGY